jgi:signal transduction histidine kinase
MGSKFTSTVLVAVGIAVIWTQFLVDNPFSPVDPFLISRLAIVIAFIILSAALPFIVNMNIRRIIAEENVRKERLRLSREIHDGVAQTLHALCWQTQQVRERLGPLSEADEAHFRRLEKLAVQARQDVLEALEILRSYDKTGDFKILLQESLQNLKQYHEINYDLSIEPEEIRLGKHVELELLRICQESLANIRRHSHARHVKVRIKQLEESLELSIQDDGQGFDSMAYFRRKGAIRDHHGLLMMQERVQQINGHLQVLSMPERGTLIKVEVPSPSKNRL